MKHIILHSSHNLSVIRAWVITCCVGFISLKNKRHLVKQKAHRRNLFLAVFLLLSLCISSASFASIIGANIANTVDSSFGLSSDPGSSFSINSNTVNETIVAEPTDASIAFYQIANGTLGALSLMAPSFVGADPVTSSAFAYPQLTLSNQLDPANYPSAAVNPQTSPVDIIESESLRSGDPVFIVLDDGDRNINDLGTLSIVQDTLTVIVSNESGDSVTLTLSEIADPSAAPGEEYNTGRFVGFIPTWDIALLGPVPAEFTHFLPLSPGEKINVTYTDTLNSSGAIQSRIDSLISNTNIRVFNSISGELLSNASVSLLHGPVTSPAPVLCSDVFGPNGQAFDIYDPILCPSAASVFPSLVSDINGEVSLPYTDFTNPNGYFLRVSQDSVRPGPSLIESNLELLAEGFSINGLLSFEKLFIANTFLPLNFDIPKDSVESDIVVEKSTNTNKTGIGEYVQYTVTVSNQDQIFPILGLQVEDQLPKGFRFVKDTARIDGVKVNDPVISSDGQVLRFEVDELAKGEVLNIQYITEVTSGADIGLAINTAVANDTFGNQSNKAQAQVSVIDDLLRTKNFIVGRVFHSTCNQEVNYSIQMKQKKIGEKIFYQAYVEGGSADISDVNVIFTLPKSITYSSQINSSQKNTANAVSSYRPMVSNQGQTLTFNLGDLNGYWEKTLSFSADVKPGVFSELNVSAELIFNDDENKQSAGTNLVLQRTAGTAKIVSYQFKTRFKSFDTKFPELNEEELNVVREFLSDKNIDSVEVEGHSDSQKIRSISQSLFANNKDLSEARAKAVAEYIFTKFPDHKDKLVLSGKGAAEPIDKNTTALGRNNNRRVELHIDTWEVMDASQLELPLLYSDAQRIKFEKAVNDGSDIALGVNQAGLAGVRVLLEDGSYVVTDKEGKYHFTGIEPGTHVVQVDQESLPNHLELFYCQGNTRFAGVPYSQFVDPQAGSLWRADFYVRKKAIETIQTSATLKSFSSDNDVQVKLSIEGNQENSKSRRATFILPENYRYQKGSAQLNNRSISEPLIQENILSFEDINLSNDTLNLQLLLKKKRSYDVAENIAGELEGEEENTEGQVSNIEASYSFIYNESRERISGLATELGTDSPITSSEERKTYYLKTFREKKSKVPEKPLQEELALKDLGEDWLNETPKEIAAVLPVSNFVPSSPSADFAVKHLPEHRARLEINGQPVDGNYYDGTSTNKNRTLKVTRWRGVFLNNGDNLINYRIYDEKYNLIKTIDKHISYIEKIEKIEIVEKYSYLVADGVTRPRIAIRLTNYKGQAVRQGLQGRFTVSAPYSAYQESEELSINPLGGYTNDPFYTIADEGIAIIELQPTTQSGTINIDLQITGKSKRIETWLSPEPRDWILVGLAEGTAAHNSIKQSATSIPEDEADGYYDEGRLAFYAKGRVRGDWLLTAAYDSERDDELARLQQFVDPSMYFTLYGDATQRGFDAQSSEELFLRIERKQFYALFGDYDTGLSQTELGRYSRALTGIKSEYKGKYFSYNAFASEETSNHVKDEIQGDGTSGLYRLTQNNILINSETITIETRDRFRSQDIKETTTLRRFLDYEIDYIEGTILFKQPVFSRDSELDPNIIVIDYETTTPVDGDITSGGRVAVQTPSQDAELGVTLVNDSSNNIDSQLLAIDASLQINEQLELKLEGASSQSNTTTSNDIEGQAFIAELNQQNDHVQSSLYFRENENNFGIGQQNDSEGGTTKVGGIVRAAITNKTELNAEAYQQDNMDNDNTRQVIEAKALYKQNKYSLEAGMRNASDEVNQETQESQLLLLGARTRVLKNKVNLRVNTETGLSESENIDNPDRYVIGADYHINTKATLYSEHEVTEGSEKDTQTTRVGIKSVPWRNARMNTSIEDNFSENSERTFANFGLVQSLPLTERWTIDLGFDASETVNDNNASFDENSTPVSGDIISNDFTAVSLGSNYRADQWAIAKRIESRRSDTNDRLGLLIGWQRQLIDGIAYSAKVQAFNTETANSAQNHSEEFNGEASASIAYRPISSPWIILDRLQYNLDEQKSDIGETGSGQALLATDIRTSKWVNNLKTNYLSNRRNQISLNHGIKYVKDNIDGISLSGTTQFFGFEYRYDIHERWDIGVQNSLLLSHSSNNRLYSYGANVGWNAAQNLWMSVGYNIKGFTDGDFDAADYTVAGPWLKLRFKYDQNTLKDLGLSSK